jgi:hypothetical protein
MDQMLPSTRAMDKTVIDPNVPLLLLFLEEIQKWHWSALCEEISNIIRDINIFTLMQ